MNTSAGKRRLGREIGKRIVALLVGLVLLKVFGCNGLFYVPDRAVYSSPQDHVGVQEAGAFDSIEFSSADGTLLHGWFLRSATASPAKGTVVHFHGNAQNLTSHAFLSSWLTGHGLNVFVFDYRGYGRSGGSPGRDGVHADGLAALAHVRSRADVDPDRIVVLGQSLGGAVALAALGEGEQEGVRAIAILSSFLYYRDVANDALGGSVLTYPLIWLAISNAHSPGDSIARLGDMPKLVIHGTDDSIVPLENGRAIFEALPGPKSWSEIERGGHDLSAPHERDRVRREIARFFLEALASG